MERHTREADGKQYVFYLNCTDEIQQVKDVKGTNLLNGEQVDGMLALSPYDVAILA